MKKPILIGWIAIETLRFDAIRGNCDEVRDVCWHSQLKRLHLQLPIMGGMAKYQVSARRWDFCSFRDMKTFCFLR
jgi:hypothetical protein